MHLVRLLAGLLLTTTVACASSASHRAASSSREARETRATGDLRVMTFNIHSGLQGLDKVAEVIRTTQPDVVALQEVDIGSRRSRGLHQLAVLSERTGMPYSAHFRTTSLYGGDYGVAILSRFPLEQVEQHPLPVLKGMEPRTVAHAIIKVDGREVSIYATHLTKRPFNGTVRMQQGVAILRLMDKDPRPKVLMGDMNDTPNARSMRLFKRKLMDVFALRGEGQAETYPMTSLLPDLRIDYVLASEQFMPKRSRVLRTDASDHYPVVADLTLLEAPVEPSAEVVERPRTEATTSSQ